MEQIIIKICIMLLSISNICLLIVVTKITDKVNLHHKLISEILDNLCKVLGKARQGKEEEDEC